MQPHLFHGSGLRTITCALYSFALDWPSGMPTLVFTANNKLPYSMISKEPHKTQSPSPSPVLSSFFHLLPCLNAPPQHKELRTQILVQCCGLQTHRIEQRKNTSQQDTCQKPNHYGLHSAPPYPFVLHAYYYNVSIIETCTNSVLSFVFSRTELQSCILNLIKLIYIKMYCIRYLLHFLTCTLSLHHNRKWDRCTMWYGCYEH